MLIVNPRIGEQLLIGDDLVLEVLDINGQEVRFGIAAPADARVLLDDLLDQDGNAA